MRTYKQKERQGFILFHENNSDFEMLTDSEAGAVIKAAFCYSMTGSLPEPFYDRMVNSVWNSVKAGIDRSIERWDEQRIKSLYAAYCKSQKKANAEPLDFESWYEGMISANTGKHGETPVTPCNTGEYQLNMKLEQELNPNLNPNLNLNLNPNLEQELNLKREQEREVQRGEPKPFEEVQQQGQRSKDDLITAIDRYIQNS